MTETCVQRVAEVGVPAAGRWYTYIVAPDSRMPWVLRDVLPRGLLFTRDVTRLPELIPQGLSMVRIVFADIHDRIPALA